MGKKEIIKKKRNPQDLTLRNLRALKSKVAQMANEIDHLESLLKQALVSANRKGKK